MLCVCVAQRTQRGAAKDHDLAEREPKRFASMLVERLQRVKNDVENLARVEHSIKAIEVRHTAFSRVQPACVAEWLGAWDGRDVKAIEAGGRELEPRPAHCSRMSF